MLKRRIQNTRQRRRRGFTLLEVLLVVAILGVIAAMVVPNLLGRQQKAMIDQSKINIINLENILKQYAIDHDGAYPETLPDLLTPVDREGNAMRPYLPSPIEDAWGRELNYEKPTVDDPTQLIVARIWSNGADGNSDDGSGDDINNWTRQSEE